MLRCKLETLTIWALSAGIRFRSQFRFNWLRFADRSHVVGLSFFFFFIVQPPATNRGYVQTTLLRFPGRNLEAEVYQKCIFICVSGMLTLLKGQIVAVWWEFITIFDFMKSLTSLSPCISCMDPDLDSLFQITQSSQKKTKKKKTNRSSRRCI